MIPTFSMTPYITVIMGGAGHLLILLYAIWMKNCDKIKGISETKLWRFLRGVFFILYAFLGTIMVDTALCWLFGQWIYADWRFQLPAVLISLLFGIQYIWGTVFRKLKISPAILFVIMAIWTLVILHWYLPQNMPVGDSYPTIFTPLWGSILIYIVLCLIGLKFPKIFLSERVFLDSEAIYEKIYTDPVNWVCFFIALFEAWAKFKGASLFAW